jgi:hypothetical protein
MRWPADPGLTEVLRRVSAAVRLPRMSMVSRRGTPAHIDDLETEVRGVVRRLAGDAPGGDVPGGGAEIAVGVGSRGIAGIGRIVAAAVGELRRAGFRPFIVPAMGSHGGGTAQGQREVLASYGITAESHGVPVRATMRTVVVGEVAGTPVHLDRNVAAAGRAILIARVKPHTDFRGHIESGAAKMAAIGLGKQAGAQALHGQGIEGLRTVMPAIGRFVADRYLLGAVVVVEDEFDQTMTVQGLAPAEIGRDGEAALLTVARAALPRLPVAAMDVLVVDRMGKDISGTGLDPNVIGRFLVPELPEPQPAPVRAIVVLDLTAASHGNAIGVGLADFIPERLVSRIDLSAFYVNVLTSGWAGLRRGRLPMVVPTDRDAILAAVAVCGPDAATAARIVWIQDTLHTATCAVSEALWPVVADDPDLRLVGEPFALTFDASGRLSALGDP